jgi:hypothetical protein
MTCRAATLSTILLSGCLQSVSSRPASDSADPSAADVGIDAHLVDALLDARPLDMGRPARDASPEDAGPEDASPEDASPEDASPEDASISDAAPEPSACADPVGRWMRFDRCLQAFDTPRVPLDVCWSGHLLSSDRRSLLDVRADGTFELVCRHDDERSGSINDRCELARPTCEDALASLDPAPAWWDCDAPDQARCTCTVAQRRERAIRGTWALAVDRVRLIHPDGELSVPCRADGPLQGYHVPTCGRARPLAVPQTRHAALPKLHVSASADGFHIAWIDRGAWRARLDRRGDLVQPAHRVDLRDPTVLQVTALALVDDDLFAIERLEDGCRVVQHDGVETRVVAEGVECFGTLVGARRADRVELVGARSGGVWHLTAGAGPVQIRNVIQDDTRYAPAATLTDDALAIATDGLLKIGETPVMGSLRRVLTTRLRWDAPRQTLFAAHIESPDRIGDLHVSLHRADGTVIERALVAQIGSGAVGADIHVEGDGYRVFWGDLDVRVSPVPVPNQEVLTWRLDAQGDPIGAPQRLTNVPGGWARYPIVFPAADGYTVFYSAGNRVQHTAWWSMMHVPFSCLD